MQMHSFHRFITLKYNSGPERCILEQYRQCSRRPGEEGNDDFDISISCNGSIGYVIRGA